jgi:hypothetical protein
MGVAVPAIRLAHRRLSPLRYEVFGQVARESMLTMRPLAVFMRDVSTHCDA